MSKINLFLRKRINTKNRERLDNKDFSLLSNNCLGGFILHDLGLRFNSPFINLWLKPGDFIKYLTDIEYYRKLNIEFVKDDTRPYPVGQLDGIRFYFQHYKNKEEAACKWRERSERLAPDNMFVIMTERDGCTYEDLKRFDSLAIKNKIVFTYRQYPEIRSSYYIPGFEEEGSVGYCWKFKNRVTGRKIYDIFPYVDWFNGKRIK